MAVSYENQLIRANQLDLFLDFSRVLGRIPAMRRWGFKNDESVVKLYEKHTGDEHYGDKPLVKYPYLRPGQTGWDYLYETIYRQVLEASARLEELEAERKEDKELIAHLTQGQEDELALGLVKLFSLPKKLLEPYEVSKR